MFPYISTHSEGELELILCISELEFILCMLSDCASEGTEFNLLKVTH